MGAVSWFQCQGPGPEVVWGGQQGGAAAGGAPRPQTPPPGLGATPPSSRGAEEWGVDNLQAEAGDAAPSLPAPPPQGRWGPTPEFGSSPTHGPPCPGRAENRQPLVSPGTGGPRATRE
ncbi:proline-rich protein HaeIII subfamily 1-like isoform X1 [Choloepus didactylus]|uniref:proline-rich protein HaeIII subfamily 1-like isoform X1 n=1 Tax=Choloepus didactylus TaxID=27675 RepID=UPI00189F1B44|nr:proline-rich protein HaeIII subfamily 1-like isoform X1 [Choloepus didactylus]